jgi:L-ascorbate metabolism protein UlaG (beta-lactamase superfamily)
MLAGTPREERLRIKWLGQAGFMIEGEDLRIYVDPFAIGVNELKGDAIFITHADFDHCDLASINQLLKDSGTIYSPPDCGIKLGVSNLILIEPENTYLFESIEVETVHAYSASDPAHPRGSGVGFIFNIAGLRIYHAGDTEVIPEIGDLENIDIAILPIGLEEHSMNKEDAAVAARIINANITIPMQFPNPEYAKEFASQLPDMNIELLLNRDLVIYQE